jgi:hypothetical protein
MKCDCGAEKCRTTHASWCSTLAQVSPSAAEVDADFTGLKALARAISQPVGPVMAGVLRGIPPDGVIHDSYLGASCACRMCRLQGAAKTAKTAVDLAWDAQALERAARAKVPKEAMVLLSAEQYKRLVGG